MQTKSESCPQNSTPDNPEAPPVDIHPDPLGTIDPVSHDYRELRKQFEQICAERDMLLDRQRQMAELMKSTNPEKIVHDLRNLINELQLYKMLVETQQ